VIQDSFVAIILYIYSKKIIIQFIYLLVINIQYKMSLPTISNVRPIYNTKSRLFIGADTDIKTNTSFSTIIAAVNNPINLEAQKETGTVIEIRNAAGGNVTINSAINLDGAPNNQLVMADDTLALLMYINGNDVREKYRLISGNSVGLTLQ